MEQIFMRKMKRSPIVIGQSGAAVVRVTGDDGVEWIEKTASPDHAQEVVALRWCAGRLPVPVILAADDRVLKMTLLPGVDLTRTPMEVAAEVMADGLRRIHALRGCSIQADWATRLRQAETNVSMGLVDEAEFDEDRTTRRSALDVLLELKAMPPLPPEQCFTHGDACLENFLANDAILTGIVDWGRAGMTHPAQDWALALRSMGDQFGPEGERHLRKFLPANCRDEQLLRRFRLLDELF